MLEDVAEFDYWNLTCSTNNQGWEDNSNNIEPWFDIQPQKNMVALKEFVTQGLERMTEMVEESFVTM